MYPNPKTECSKKRASLHTPGLPDVEKATHRLARNVRDIPMSLKDTTYKPLRFLDLPREVRFMVYDYLVPRGAWKLFRSNLSDKAYDHYEAMPIVCRSLQRTCKTIRQEVLRLWRMHNSIEISLRHNGGTLAGHCFGVCRDNYSYCSGKHISPEQLLVYSRFTVNLHYISGGKALALLQNLCWFLAALLSRKPSIRNLRIMVRSPFGPVSDEGSVRRFCSDARPLLHPFKVLLSGLRNVEVSAVADLEDGSGSSYHLDASNSGWMLSPPGIPDCWEMLCRGVEAELMRAKPHRIPL